MFAALVAATLIAPPPLPAAWHGTWSGPLVLGSGPAAKRVPMTLAVRPLPAGRCSWEVTYDAGGPNPVAKRYELAPTAARGVFEIDEKNGVRILARLGGDGKSLASLFRVGDQLIHTTYTLSGDAVRFELTAFGTADALRTTAGGTAVTSYRLAAAQAAELKRTR